MTEEELQGELNFYQRAYGSDPEYSAEKRIARGFGWEDKISPTVVELVEILGLQEGASTKKFLDLGCGDGRSSEYFRQLGFAVTGVDFSPEALKVYQARFSGDPKVQFALADLTVSDVLKPLGQFDIILDWSVLDHIRPAYVPTFTTSVIDALKDGGYFITATFDTLPGLEEGNDSKTVNGHYSKIYRVDELVKILQPLKLVSKKEHTLEDTHNNIYFNTAVFKK